MAEGSKRWALRDVVGLVVAMSLVGAMLFGPVLTDRVATAATTTTHRLTIPPGAFIPVEDGMSYENNGAWLQGSGFFTAPIPFYRPGDRVQAANITLFAIDNQAGHICVNIFRAKPADGTEDSMVQACSTGAAPGIRSFKVTVPAPRNITQFQAPYLWLQIAADAANLRFYGVRVTYKVTQ